jgi:hypothetical protein
MLRRSAGKVRHRSVMPSRRMSILLERLDAFPINRSQARKGGVERVAALLAAAAITGRSPKAGHRQDRENVPARRAPPAERENPLEAAKCRCYYSNGQSDYF